MMHEKRNVYVRSSNVKTSMDEAEVQQSLKDLHDAFLQIHNRDSSSLSFEELYRKAYRLTLEQFGSILYTAVQTCQEEHVKRVAQILVEEVGDSFLQMLCVKWKEFQRSRKMMSDILMYLDRTYCKKEKRRTVDDLSLHLFVQHVLRHKIIKAKYLRVILNNIQKEREGRLIDTSLMREALQILKGVTHDKSKALYIDYFEQHFLEDTGRFYRSESVDTISKCTISEFLQKADARIEEERRRVEAYLYLETLEPLIEIVIETWIREHCTAIVQDETSGCIIMFRDDKLSDIARAYSLFIRVPNGLKELEKAFEGFLEQCGGCVIKDPELKKDPSTFVESLFALKRKSDSIISIGFSDDKGFRTASKTAFERIVNSNTLTAQFVALYVDDLFKKRRRVMSDPAERDGIFDDIISIFRFLNDKDLFEMNYRHYLGRRILSGRCESPDEERNLICRIKAECGHTYTAKMEGLLNDVSNSEELCRHFQTHRIEIESLECDDSITTAAAASTRQRLPELDIKVLMAGNWPAEKQEFVHLCPAIQHERLIFESYYNTLHTGRRLTWLFSQGSAVIRAVFPKGVHDITCSTYQMCILMLYNDHSSLSLENLKNYIQICESELRRHFLSLSVCTKIRILRKVDTACPLSTTKCFSDTDQYIVNDEFENRAKRFKAPLVASGCNGMRLASLSTDHSSYIGESSVIDVTCDSIPTAVEETRRHLIDAAIVRIMKARKQLHHASLMTEIVSHLSQRFCPQVAMIKQRIEVLITREYLDRSSSDRKVYNYIA